MENVNYCLNDRWDTISDKNSRPHIAQVDNDLCISSSYVPQIGLLAQNWTVNQCLEKGNMKLFESKKYILFIVEWHWELNHETG